jgi:hypothetical protein
MVPWRRDQGGENHMAKTKRVDRRKNHVSPYVWVKIRRRDGKVLGVWSGDRPIGRGLAKKRGKPGSKGQGDSTNEGREIAQATNHQVLYVDENSDGGIENPCCYRDPATGDEWCWC